MIVSVDVGGVFGVHDMMVHYVTVAIMGTRDAASCQNNISIGDI